MKFKYVKFSRGTAKKNPQMIVREYEKIIEDYSKNIDKAKTNKNKIKVGLNRDVVHQLEMCPEYYFRKNSTVDLIFNYDELKNITEEIELKCSNIIKKTRELVDIKEEFNLFKQRYIKCQDQYDYLY